LRLESDGNSEKLIKKEREERLRDGGMTMEDFESAVILDE
jgi:hypothetical protein